VFQVRCTTCGQRGLRNWDCVRIASFRRPAEFGVEYYSFRCGRCAGALCWNTAKDVVGEWQHKIALGDSLVIVWAVKTYPSS